MDIDTIRAMITELSGSGKKVMPGARRHGIYSSFTLPGLDDMLAVRDTKQRFTDFGIPERVDGKTVLDIGSNVGAVALEFARRGATVVGVEYRLDRVELCEAMAKRWELNATFHQDDFNTLEERWADAPWWRQYDYVWCSSVDEYISNLPWFYGMMRKLCGGTLYFESNLQVRNSELLAHCWLKDASFTDVRYVGNGHSGGIARKRKLFVAEGGPL